ncbi:hypothetical protein [Polaromonas sp.]|uniref:hypothetical protein n=1 Tax=Polaromonas sp. TaxID=1869339 RepID=UPI00286AB1E8|nr:hypothetical protein [Polaromonas sp.]
MTSLKIMADFSSAHHADFVTTDAAELASHMDHCASAHGRFFPLQSALQSVHAVVSPRIVTVGVLALIGFGLLALA